MRSDPFGARVLYWTTDGDGVRTAATPAALGPHALDPDAVALALRGDLPSQRSLFAGVGRVPPGGELQRGPTGWRVSPYWQPPLWQDEPADAATPEALWELLRHAVRSRVHGARAACALSGGVDSAAIACVLRFEGLQVRALTLADDFAPESEAARAQQIATQLGIDSVQVPVREADLPAAFPDAVRACQSLLWNGRAAASLLFFRGVREAGESILLSGVGADEVLCGNPPALTRLAAEQRERAHLADSVLVPPRGPLHQAAAPPGVAPLVHAQDECLRHVLPESTLPPECGGAAAADVDVRFPYLDLDFAEWALRLPLASRTDAGLGKRLLREALRDKLPDAIRLQPKTARLAPVGGNGAVRAAWRALAGTWLSRDHLERLPMLDAAAVAQLRARCATTDATPAEHALLLRLVSLAILNAQEGAVSPRSSAVPGR